MSKPRHLTIIRKLQRCVLTMLLLSPALMQAETLNMQKFGRVEKPVTETIDFYDPMGTADMNGSNASAFSTVVFTPANPGEAVQITFSRIRLQGDGASYPVSLSIFDGNYNENITYPSVYTGIPLDGFPDNGRLIERYSSAADKTLISKDNVTFTSTDPDGSLSVCFQWKYAAKSEGWEATVTSVTLTEQELVSVTPDYFTVNQNPYGGMKDITLGCLNVNASGILNPYTATSLSFELDDATAALENVRLFLGSKQIEATPVISGQRYSYTLDNKISSGDNIYTVKADVKNDAVFYATASLKFTDFTTDSPETPVIDDITPLPVTIAAVALMPADGSHISCNIEEGKSVLFYDNGGPDANYPENSSGIVTFKPSDGAEGKVMLDFTSIALFNTNPQRDDRLIVYDGTEVNPDKILVTLLKQTKAVVRSTSPDGSLTVSFATTTGVTKAGWEATASLFTPQAMTLVGTDVTSASTETVAAGDTNSQLLKLRIKTKDTEPAMTLSGINLDFATTSPQWERVKIFSTRNNETFTLDNALLQADVAVSAETANVNFETPQTLLEGDNYLWILADIKVNAQSGTKVNAIIKSLTLNGESVTIGDPTGQTGREVYNLIYPSANHPVKNVYGSMAVANKPYSTYYGGYDGSTTDQLVTVMPSQAGCICELEFSKLNLYYSTYSWDLVTPTFEVYAGTEATGTPLYTHVKENNLQAGDDDTKIGIIRSTADNGALTIRFNAGTSSSSSCKDDIYGFLGEVREYQSRPMTVTSAEARHTGQTTVAVSSAVNVPVISLNVTTDGNLNPATVNNISFGIKADSSIYTKLKIAASGRKATPENAEIIAATDEIIDGEVTFAINTTLAEGDNIFWLLADVSAEAAPGSVIDAKVNNLTVNESTMTVNNPDPDGEIMTVNTYDPILGNKDQVVEVGEYPILINGVTAAFLANDYTITAKPATEGGKVTAKFTEGSFNVNTSNQYITVIGGNQPFGVDHDTVYPVSITSAREDGSLTIEYHSMTIAIEAGWKCELTCDTRKPFTINNVESVPAGNGQGTAGSESLLYGLKFNVSGDKDNITLTSFDFDIEDAADIFSEFRLYATGASGEFMRSNLIAATDVATTSLSPKEPYIISAEGTYHFWLQGVVKTDAANSSATVIKPTSINYTNIEASSVDLTALDAKNFKVVGGFHGVHRIGSSAEAEYGNLADALADMETGIDGPVEFIIEPGTYNELVELDHIPGASSVNTITFTGATDNPADVVLAYNTWDEPPYSDDKLDFYYGVFTLRGTSYVTLRGISLRTTQAEFPSVIHIAEGSSYITIDNCALSAPTYGTNYNSLALVNSYVNMSAATGNDRLSISNTDFSGGYTGVKFGSTSVNQPESEGFIATGCSFANQVYQAIYIYKAKDINISDNTMTGGMSSAQKNYCQMIDLDISGPASIRRNILKYDKTGVYGMYLRRLEGSDVAPVIIANNVIDIDVEDKTGAGIQLYNSTSKPYTGFLMAHNTIRTTGYDVVMPLIINAKVGTQINGRIANNILQNEAGYYVIKEQYGPSGATYLNNAGYTTSSDSSYAYWGGDYNQEMTFNQWILESEETGAVNTQVYFNESDETKPLFPISFADLKSGTPLAEVTTDILGTVRSAVAPTIGAYEASATSDIDNIECNDGSILSDDKTEIIGNRLSVTADNAELRIYSMSGMLLMQTRVNGQTDIDVSGLPRGLCILTVGDKASRIILK